MLYLLPVFTQKGEKSGKLGENWGKTRGKLGENKSNYDLKSLLVIPSCFPNGVWKTVFPRGVENCFPHGVWKTVFFDMNSNLQSWQSRSTIPPSLGGAYSLGMQSDPSSNPGIY